MGKAGAERQEPADQVMRMDEKKIEGIPTYRTQAIVKTAAVITETLVSGKHLYNPTYQECEIVIELVAETLKKCKNVYRRK